MIDTIEELELALTDEKKFKELITNSNELVSAAAKFPDRAEELIQSVILNPEKFKSIFKGSYAFELLSTRFSNHKDEFILLLLNDPNIFKQVIKGPSDLEIFNHLYPNHKDELIKPILTNPDIFKSVIKGPSSLEHIKAMYPEHNAVFGKATIAEALNVVRSKTKESEEFTRGATVGALSEGELSQHLPPEVLSHIGSFLTRREGGTLAQVNKKADETGKDLEKQEKNRPRPGKK